MGSKTKTRLANKTIWALEDITASCLRATGHWQAAMTKAEQRMDPVLMQALARLRDELASIESTTRDARQGEYRQG
jgi:hypothetical protein